MFFLILPAAAGCSSSIFQSKEKSRQDQRQWTNEAENEISGSNVLRENDSLCRKISLPEGFIFISKQVNNHRAVSFNYSSEMKFIFARKFYLDYFDTNGWRSGTVDSVIFSRIYGIKDGYKVTVAYREMVFSEIDYSITCEKLDNPFYN
jgi:hypothetical protein